MKWCTWLLFGCLVIGLLSGGIAVTPAIQAKGNAPPAAPSDTVSAMAERLAAPAADDPLWRLGGSAEAVAVQGNYAYMVQGAYLLAINLTTQQVEGQIAFEYQAMDVAVSGDYAYVVTSTYGDLHVVDIRDPANLAAGGTGPLISGGSCLAFRWPYVYVLGKTSSEMLVVFDVTNPAAPSKVKEMALSRYGQRAKLGAQHLYVVSPTGYLGIVDITNPADPQEGQWLAVWDAENLAVAEPYVYVGGTVGFKPGVHIVNVGDPANPQEVGSWGYTDTGSALGLAAMGNYLYMGYNHNGFGTSDAIHILDVSDPTQPSRVEHYAVTAGLYNFLLQGTTLYIAGGGDGDLLVLDLTNPINPTQKMYLNQPGAVQQVYRASDRAYVVVASDHDGPWSGVWVYDVSDPLSPVVVDKEDPLGSIYDLAVAGSYLYLCGSSGVRIRNVADIDVPLGRYTPENGSCAAMAVQGNTAYVAIDYLDYSQSPPNSYGLDVVDASSPVSPTLARRIHLGTKDEVSLMYLNQVAVEGKRAYVGKWLEQFYVFDISTPLIPSLVVTHSLPGLETLHTEGNYVYAGTSQYDGTAKGLTVLDATNVQDIQPVSTFPTPNTCEGVDVVDSIAYLSGYYFVHALDVASPAAPTTLWSYSGPAEGGSIQGLGLYILVADGDLGLTLHAIADGLVRPAGGNPSTVFPQDPLVVTFARSMNTGSVTYTCTPDPGGWQAAWRAASAVTYQANGSRVLTLSHNPFAENQDYTFTVTGGQTADGDPIAPFSLSFSVVEVQYVYLPLVVR
jgi:hypothetical protein